MVMVIQCVWYPVICIASGIGGECDDSYALCSAVIGVESGCLSRFIFSIY
jgi:hypothetical protein